MANNNISVNVVANTSSMDSSFEKSYNKAQKIYSKPIKTNVDIQGIEKSIQPLGKITSNFKEFEKSLDAATARVVAFTATTGLIYGLGNAFKRLTSDAIQVEASVARIQSILKASDKDLSNFTDSIFKLANNTGQSFYDAAKAAEEFARQGLSLEKTLKATESALIVARLSGSNLEDIINGLVATVSSFSNELLDYGKVANTLVGIDAKFSTSAAGLIEGIKRVGTVASDAGVSFEELSSAIAAVRQVTGRSESVIGNGLKTIFTNLQTEKVQQELAKLGIQTQKSTGEFLPLITVVDQLAGAFQKLNDSQRADLGQKIAGKYQINTFKALLQSFGGADTSLFDQALQTAKSSQDDAIKRNELLNQTTLSSLNKLNNSITSLGNSFGSKIGKPLVDALTDAATKGLEVLTGVFKDNPIGDFLTGGILSVLKGPGIALAGIALGKLTKRIVTELTDAVKSVGGLNSKTQQNLQLDQAINEALKNGNAERVRAITLARSLEERQLHLNALLRESFPQQSSKNLPYSGAVSLVNDKTRKQVLNNRPKNAAGGVLPAINQEQVSIQNGVGGARKTARPVLTKLNMASGMTPVVVNTDEHIIRNFANTGKDAVFNRNMTRQAGGAQSLGRFGNVEKVMAAGYTPRVKGVTPSILEAPFIPTSGETFGLDPRKLDFIRKITENVTGARTKPVRFRKNLENYGEFWPDSNNVLVNPKVISDKSPYYGGYSVPAHEYGHFMEYNSDPALMDLFKSAYKFDVKKKGSLFNQMYKKIGSGAGYSKKNYFSESFADTFAYSFLDRGDREPALGGRAMSDLMRELIMNNIPVKSKANGFIPNFARRSRFQEKDDDILGLLDDLDLDNIGYIPGGRFLSDRSVRRGSNWESFTRFTADRKNRIIKIEDTESRQKGDAFKNYSAIADFAKRKDFIIKSSALVKQRSRDNTKDKGIDLLYKLFPQLRYRDGVTKNTSGKYHIGESEKKFSSFHDLRSQIGQLGDDSIRKISKFSDIQDNFAGGMIPNFAKQKSKRELREERKQRVFDYTTSFDEFPGMAYTDAYGKYDKGSIKRIRDYLKSNISDQAEFTQKSDLRKSLAGNLAFVRKARNFNANNPTNDDLKFLNSYYKKNDSLMFGSDAESRIGSIYGTASQLAQIDMRTKKSQTSVYNGIKDDAEVESYKPYGFTELDTKIRPYDRDVRQSNNISDKEIQKFKLKGIQKGDKLAEFTTKIVLRKRANLQKIRYENFPMGVNSKALKEMPGRLAEDFSTKFNDPNYLGLDKVNFLSRTINEPNYIEDLIRKTEKQIYRLTGPVTYKTSNPMLYKKVMEKLEKSENFLKALKPKIDDEMLKKTGKKSLLQLLDESLEDDEDFNSDNLKPNLDIFDDELPPPPSSISINSSGKEYNKYEALGSKTQKYIEKKIGRLNNKILPGYTLEQRLKNFKKTPFLDRNRHKHIGKLIYQSIKDKRRGKMAAQDPVGAQLALGNETIKEKLGFNPESLYGFADDIDKAKYYFRGSSLDSFAIQNKLGEFTSSGFSNSDRVLGTNVSSSLLKAVGYAMSTGAKEDRPGLVGIYDAKKTREYSDSLPSPYGNEANNTLKFEKLAEKNLIAYFDPVTGRVLSKNNSLITNRKVDPYKVDYTKRLLEEGNILTKSYENSEQFKSDDLMNLYRKVNISRNDTTLKGIHAPQKIFDTVNQRIPRNVDDFISRLRIHTSTPQPGFISFGQESSNFFDLRSFRPISRDERKKMGKSKALERDSYLGKGLIYKKQVKSNDLVDMATLEALRNKDPKEIEAFFSQDRIYDLDSILGKSRGYSSEREFTAFTTKPQFNIGRLIAKSAANGIVPNFANPLKDSISREYDALSDMGYPSYVAKNSIKVGSHDRLKSGNNPNGLGVYNTAQGQMSLGQALGQHAGQSLSKGIIPNFADQGSFDRNELSKFIQSLGKKFSKLETNLGKLDQSASKLITTFASSSKLKTPVNKNTVKSDLKRLIDSNPTRTPDMGPPGKVAKPTVGGAAGINVKPYSKGNPIESQLKVAAESQTLREAQVRKETNDQIKKDNIERSKKASRLKRIEKDWERFGKETAESEKRLKKVHSQREKRNKIISLVENRVSAVQFGGPQENLDKIVNRASKTLGAKKISEIQSDFKSRERKAFDKLSSQTSLFTSDKKLNKLAAKLNISTASEGFSQIRERRSARRGSAMQTASFGLPFVVGGIANTMGGQDTREGRITSAVGEGLGTALLLSQFGPLGIAAGVAVAAFQSFSAIAGELGPDFNELSKKSREVSAANEKEVASLQGFLEATTQLKSLAESGASPSIVAQAKINLSNAGRMLSGGAGSDLLNAKNDEERVSVIQKVTSENQRKQALADSQLLGAGLIKEKASGSLATAERFIGNRKFLGASDAQSLAGEFVKSIDLSKISPEALEKAKTGTASLKDLGLDNSQINSVLINLDKFFSNGTTATKAASEQVLKFTQSLIVGQKAVDELASQQVETAKIFASTKESFLNILTSTFAGNQSKNRSLLSDNEINFTKAEGSLSLLSSSLSPEAILKGNTAIKQKRIDQEDAVRRNAISEEYTSKILDGIMSQASNTPLETQIKIQDVLNKNVTGESPFDPLKLTGDIQSLLDPYASKALQSQLLKANIEIAAKLDESNNQSKLANEQLNQQTLIEEKQLSDTRLINALGGFKSNFRDVLRSIKEPKGGLTTVARGEASNGYQFGEISNLGGAKVGSIEAVNRSQRNLEIATNRSDLFSDIVLPQAARERLNKRNYNDTYLAAKSNVENRALAFGQNELLPQFDILKSSVAGKDQGSIVRKAIDAQLSSIKKSFDIGQTPTITPDFVKTVQSIIPKDQSGSIQRALDSIINGIQLTEDIFTSSNESAKALADQTVKTDKLPPEFDAQIQAIGNNTSIIAKNTLSLNTLNTVLDDLPVQLSKLQEISKTQVDAFITSNQISGLKSDSEVAARELQKLTDSESIIKNFSLEAQRDFNSSLPFFKPELDKDSAKNFIEYARKEKVTSVSGLEAALSNFLSDKYPDKREREKEVRKEMDRDYMVEMSKAVSADPQLLTRDSKLNSKESLNKELEENRAKIIKLENDLKRYQDPDYKKYNKPADKELQPVTGSTITPVVNIAFNGVGSVDPNKVKEAVYSALANINRENNLPPPIQRPVTETAIA